MSSPSKLPSFLLEDTRQKVGKHELKREWWARRGIRLIRSKLVFGDYCLPPEVVVDTKASIYELAYDIDHDHARFKREIVGARDAGVRLVVLVENEFEVRTLADLAAWDEPPTHFAARKGAKRRISGARLAHACSTMGERYGVRFEFCAPGESAEKVLEILSQGGAS